MQYFKPTTLGEYQTIGVEFTNMKKSRNIEIYFKWPEAPEPTSAMVIKNLAIKACYKPGKKSLSILDI